MRCCIVYKETLAKQIFLKYVWYQNYLLDFFIHLSHVRTFASSVLISEAQYQSKRDHLLKSREKAKLATKKFAT